MFFNDEYTLDIDQLGYKKQADIARKIILECQTPYSLGISGKWGSGKTSLMKYLMASLGGESQKYRFKFTNKYISDLYDEEKKYKTVQDLYRKKDTEYIHTVWFNPWEHENDEEPFIALLKEIRHYFDLKNKLIDQSKKIAHTSVQAGLDMLGSLISVGKNQASNIVNIGEKYELDNFETISRNERYRLIFQEAVEKLLTHLSGQREIVSKNAKLVIFIDDLDRCEESTISKLLREIKQHLSTSRCVFVFGYDRHHVEKSLANSLARSSKETRSYLEKLFQSTIYIKEAPQKKLKSFIQSSIEKLACLPIADTDEEHFILYLIELIDTNPRRIKTYLNALYLHIGSGYFGNSSAIDLDDLKKLALITYLKIHYEPVYAVLENKSSILESIISVCKNKDRNLVNNQREHFVYLEFSPHIHDIDAAAYIDGNLRQEILKNNNEIEKKFLDEIYEMQGKYRSFEYFANEFENHFFPFIGNPEYKIQNYL